MEYIYLTFYFFNRWWLSRNKLAIEIRKTRVGISYKMQTNSGFDRNLIKRFILLNFLYVLINTLIKFWKDRVVCDSQIIILFYNIIT